MGKRVGEVNVWATSLCRHPASEPCVLSHGSSPSGRSRVRPREAVVAWHACQRHGIPFARAPDYGKQNLQRIERIERIDHDACLCVLCVVAYVS
jgi:hypothetical protein